MKCDQSIYFRLHRCFIDPDIGRQSIEQIGFAQTRLITVWRLQEMTALAAVLRDDEVVLWQLMKYIAITLKLTARQWAGA